MNKPIVIYAFKASIATIFVARTYAPAISSFLQSNCASIFKMIDVSRHKSGGLFTGYVRVFQLALERMTDLSRSDFELVFVGAKIRA